MILLPISAVVGTNIVKSNDEKRSIASPLFAVRTQRYVRNEGTKRITSNYLGKGKALNLLFPTKASFHDRINKALKLIENRPNLIDTILARLEKTPEVINLLEAHNIDINDFKNDITKIKNDPSLLKEKYEEAEQVFGDRLKIPLNDPIEPLGLLEQWFPGALIIALMLLPIFILIGLMIATILIITCIVPQCLEAVMEAVLTGILQGLKQPETL